MKNSINNLKLVWCFLSKFWPFLPRLLVGTQSLFFVALIIFRTWTHDVTFLVYCQTCLNDHILKFYFNFQAVIPELPNSIFFWFAIITFVLKLTLALYPQQEAALGVLPRPDLYYLATERRKFYCLMTLFTRLSLISPKFWLFLHDSQALGFLG